MSHLVVMRCYACNHSETITVSCETLRNFTADSNWEELFPEWRNSPNRANLISLFAFHSCHSCLRKTIRDMLTSGEITLDIAAEFDVPFS